MFLRKEESVLSDQKKTNKPEVHLLPRESVEVRNHFTEY